MSRYIYRYVQFTLICLPCACLPAIATISGLTTRYPCAPKPPAKWPRRMPRHGSYSEASTRTGPPARRRQTTQDPSTRRCNAPASTGMKWLYSQGSRSSLFGLRGKRPARSTAWARTLPSSHLRSSDFAVSPSSPVS